MSPPGTYDPSNPCFLEQSQCDKALKLEQQLLKKSRAARSALETMKGAIDASEFRDVTRALNIGRWPEQILGPLDQTSEVFHQHQSASFVKRAKEAYLSRQKYEEARAVTTEANNMLLTCMRTPKYLKWRRSRAQTSPCGAPCTSHGREGKPCGHPLTARRVCPNHGERPPLAASAVV